MPHGIVLPRVVECRSSDYPLLVQLRQSYNPHKISQLAHELPFHSGSAPEMFHKQSAVESTDPDVISVSIGNLAFKLISTGIAAVKQNTTWMRLVYQKKKDMGENLCGGLRGVRHLEPISFQSGEPCFCASCFVRFVESGLGWIGRSPSTIPNMLRSGAITCRPSKLVRIDEAVRIGDPAPLRRNI
jgi:hypothetical protein